MNKTIVSNQASSIYLNYDDSNSLNNVSDNKNISEGEISIQTFVVQGSTIMVGLGYKHENINLVGTHEGGRIREITLDCDTLTMVYLIGSAENLRMIFRTSLNEYIVLTASIINGIDLEYNLGWVDDYLREADSDVITLREPSETFGIYAYTVTNSFATSVSRTFSMPDGSSWHESINFRVVQRYPNQVEVYMPHAPIETFVQLVSKKTTVTTSKGVVENYNTNSLFLQQSALYMGAPAGYYFGSVTRIQEGRVVFERSALSFGISFGIPKTPFSIDYNPDETKYNTTSKVVMLETSTKGNLYPVQVNVYFDQNIKLEKAETDHVKVTFPLLKSQYATATTGELSLRWELTVFSTGNSLGSAVPGLQKKGVFARGITIRTN